jgi:hypothetical protein
LMGLIVHEDLVKISVVMTRSKNRATLKGHSADGQDNTVQPFQR